MKKSSPEPAELFLRLRAALRWQNSIIIDFPVSFAALLFQTGAGLILLLSAPMIGRFGNPASKKAFGLILRMPFSIRYSFPASLRRLTQSSLTTPRERATNSASSGTSSTTVEPAAR